MLKIKTFVVNMVEENCYVLSDETREAVIIDDGSFVRGEHEAIDQYLSRENLKLKYVLNTHGHFDHTMGNAYLYEKYKLKPRMAAADADMYTDTSLQIQVILGHRIDIKVAPLGKPLNEGDVISFGTHQLKVISVPGHTPGGLCYYCKSENILFSGDSLFLQSVGRTDLPGGNMLDLINNLKAKILTLPPITKVYPGHGPTTTIQQEQNLNPYLR